MGNDGWSNDDYEIQTKQKKKDGVNFQNIVANRCFRFLYLCNLYVAIINIGCV